MKKIRLVIITGVILLIFMMVMSLTALGANSSKGAKTKVEPTNAENVVLEDIGYVNLGLCTVKLEYEMVAYDGLEKKPKIKSITTFDGKEVPAHYYTVEYSNNVEAGQATVTLKGVAEKNGSGEISAKFTILDRVLGLVMTENTSNSVNIKWESFTQVPIEGYDIFVYDRKKGIYLKEKTVDANTTEATLEELLSGKFYRVKVAAKILNKETGEYINGYLGKYITPYTKPVAPPSVRLKKAITKKPWVELTWSKLNLDLANKYEVMYSTSPDFSDSKTAMLTNRGKTTGRIFGLRNGYRYYFKVRAVKTFRDDIMASSWSGVKTAVADSNGWATVNYRKFYYTNGVTAKGEQVIGDEKYYFDPTTGECRGVSLAAWNAIKNAKSGTKYAITVSIENKRVNIYKNINNSWVMQNQWKCTTGMNVAGKDAKEYFTPIGDFSVVGKLNSFGDEEKTYTVWYATRIWGPIYFHSVLYDYRSMDVIIDGRLGIAASHGCIRLSMENAKWIFDNAKFGTRVIVVKG